MSSMSVTLSAQAAAGVDQIHDIMARLEHNGGKLSKSGMGSGSSDERL